MPELEELFAKQVDPCTTQDSMIIVPFLPALLKALAYVGEPLPCRAGAARRSLPADCSAHRLLRLLWLLRLLRALWLDLLLGCPWL